MIINSFKLRTPVGFKEDNFSLDVRDCRYRNSQKENQSHIIEHIQNQQQKLVAHITRRENKRIIHIRVNKILRREPQSLLERATVVN